MKAALIGAGMVADMHVAAIKATGGLVTLGGVYARRDEQAQAFAARHQTRVYPSVASLAQDPQIAFVIVLTPPDARAEIVETLIAAGKPILLEKPIERSFKAAAALVEMAAPVPLGVVLQHRMRPAARHLAGLLEQGALGRIASVEVTVPWWREQSYYDAPGRGSFARDGGGVLITQAIHTLDLMLHLAGPVSSLQALSAQSGLHRMEAEDFVNAGLRFASGAVGSVMASTASFPGRDEQIVLNCEKASAVLSPGALDLFWQSGEVEHLGAPASGGGGADPMAFSADWHSAVIRDFANALTQSRPPAITGEDGLAVHALIDAMQMSSRAGRVVELSEVSHG